MAKGPAGASPAQRRGTTALPKRGLRAALTAAQAAHPGHQIQLWFQDEARFGNKGRVCHRWWERGQRAPGRCDRRYQWVYLYSAICPATGADVTWLLPTVNAAMMSLFLARFAATLAPAVHAVLVLDGAGWHDPRSLSVPANVTLVPLPPYSPELNPVERVWLYLRERYLSLRVLDDTAAIADACCAAWNRLTAQPKRLKSLCAYPWITKVSS